MLDSASWLYYAGIIGTGLKAMSKSIIYMHAAIQVIYYL